MITFDLVELVLHSRVMRTIYHCPDVLLLDLQGFSSLTQSNVSQEACSGRDTGMLLRAGLLLVASSPYNFH